MNVSIVFAFVFLTLFACSVVGQSHNITWGQIGPYDRLLKRDIVFKKPSVFGGKVTKDYKFPEKGVYNNINITGIRCTDQYTNGEGGYATLSKGGVGFKNVTIHLKSQPSHGFNFIIEIYGR